MALGARQVAGADGPSCDDGSPAEVRDGLLLCVHDDDKPPAGVSARHRPDVQELRERRLGEPRSPAGVAGADAAGARGSDVGAAAGYRILCAGDGVTGPRVQAVYAVATDQPDRSADVVPLIRQYAADADLRVNRSAGVQQQGRRIRYVTSPTPDGCQLDVRVIRVSPTGDDSFDNLRAEMRAQALTRPDRKYHVWMDAAVGICGLAELAQDDRPGAENENNKGPTYARTDAPCWGYAEAHEILHTLGGVQSSAPNATSIGHCTDENDVMCYSDGSGESLRSQCPDDPVQFVDCGLDDYFAAAPAPGSYLATHWNVANSAYLEPDVAPPPAPRVRVVAPTSMLAGGSAAARADVTVPVGRTVTTRWAASRADCRMLPPTGPTSRLACPATAAGSVTITASVVDNLGLAASNVAVVALQAPAAARATALSLTLTPTSVRYGGAVRMTGRLTDAATGSGVFGMPVTAFQLVTGTTAYRTVGTGVTDTTGAVAVAVRPSVSGSVMLVASSTGTWRQATSPARAVSVGFAVSATASTPRVLLGGTIRFATTARPAATGAAVRLVLLTAAGPRTVASGALSSAGTATLAWKPSTRGTFRLRVDVPARTAQAAGSSPTLSVVVA